MEYNITTIIQAVFALIAAVITVIVIPYIKSKTTAQQQTDIEGWVRVAVSAAEQLYKGSGRGDEKKGFVLDWLKKRHIAVDEAKLDAMIEAAVYWLNHSFTAGELLTSGAMKHERTHRAGVARRNRRAWAETRQSDRAGAQFLALV